MNSYKKIAQLLYAEFSKLPPGSNESNKRLRSIAEALIPVYHRACFADGYMRELAEWASLLADAPAMARDYGEGIKLDYPEVFA